MYRLVRFFLFFLPAETAHVLTLRALAVVSAFPRLCAWLRRRALRGLDGMEVQVAGLRFAHPIALAAGLDKDAEAPDALFGLGFAAVEVGTLTPRPQPGNPKPRLFRLPEADALINRMGFNNHGAEPAAQRLARRAWKPGPLGVNVGKNKDTPLENALDDYRAAIEALAPHGDYVVVNASSPNTPGLRQLQAPEALRALLAGVRETLARVAPQKPLFLKIAPDLALEDVDAIVDVAIEAGVAGLIATNTTVTRPLSHPRSGETGGLSGTPLRALSTQILRRAHARAQGRLALIAAGGVMTADDLYEKLCAGAALVQLYTGFVYGGPGTVRRLLLGLRERMRAEGVDRLEALVGRDAPASLTPPSGPAPESGALRSAFR